MARTNYLDQRPYYECWVTSHGATQQKHLYHMLKPVPLRNDRVQ